VNAVHLLAVKRKFIGRCHLHGSMKLNMEKIAHVPLGQAQVYSNSQ
jgi:hypothetical protein